MTKMKSIVVQTACYASNHLFFLRISHRLWGDILAEWLEQLPVVLEVPGSKQLLHKIVQKLPKFTQRREWVPNSHQNWERWTGWGCASLRFCPCMYKLVLKMLFHSIGRLVRPGPDTQDWPPTAQKLSEKASSDRPQTLPQTFDCLSPRDRRLTHHPIKCPSIKYLAMFTISGLTLGSLKREICLIL